MSDALRTEVINNRTYYFKNCDCCGKEFKFEGRAELRRFCKRSCSVKTLRVERKKTGYPYKLFFRKEMND